MALFMKQDFSPPVLSPKWFAFQFRRNMLLYSEGYIVSILESGLMFREDSVEVEQEAQLRGEVGGGRVWLTRGEQLLSSCLVAAGLAIFPPRNLQRSTFLQLASYLAVPLCVRLYHRQLCSGAALRRLLVVMRDYLALARRAAACVKECAALHTKLGSVSTAVESLHELLCRQQSALSALMSRASSAALGNLVWLRSDLAWEANCDATDSLVKIHHTFLVVQSTLLKHIALAHLTPPHQARKLYRHHNERLYWLHTTVIEYLCEEFTQSYTALDRMYRLLKNYGNRDYNATKKLGTALKDNWLYSEVHGSIARTCMLLKLALNKSTDLDMFLDSCAINRQDIDLDVLNRDIDVLIDDITKCLSTAESAQMRLNKHKNKLKTKQIESDKHDETECDKDVILKIQDKEPETKDEVFYFVKTEDDDDVVAIGDVITGPGMKEKEATKVVLNELKRKLVRREDLMRERERQALVKTMPEYKDNVPEFPRQIKLTENDDKKGYITKIKNKILKKKVHHNLKAQSRKPEKYKLKMCTFMNECDISSPVYEANLMLPNKKKILTIFKDKTNITITNWCKHELENKKVKSETSEEFSDLEKNHSIDSNAYISAKVLNDNSSKTEGNVNFVVRKEDLELTSSSTDSDFDKDDHRQDLLKDVRKYRVSRKKNHPVSRGLVKEAINKIEDEGSRRVEYRFGTGMAIASMLQVNSQARIAAMAQEEVYTGDGEVSEDSGNDDRE